MLCNIFANEEIYYYLLLLSIRIHWSKGRRVWTLGYLKKHPYADGRMSEAISNILSDASNEILKFAYDGYSLPYVCPARRPQIDRTYWKVGVTYPEIDNAMEAAHFAFISQLSEWVNT
eukprot:PhF_6_TR40024/c0_g1_i2/m.59394